MEKRMNFFARMATFPDTDDCWEWPGAKVHGYGVCSLSVNAKPKRFYVYDLAYWVTYGDKPAGLHIDHLCRNRACFNPRHLEAVTQAENNRRADAGKHHREKTHCAKGHPFDEANTLHGKTAKGTPRRVCRTCHNAWKPKHPRRRATTTA